MEELRSLVGWLQYFSQKHLVHPFLTQYKMWRTGKIEFVPYANLLFISIPVPALISAKGNKPLERIHHYGSLKKKRKNWCIHISIFVFLTKGIWETLQNSTKGSNNLARHPGESPEAGSLRASVLYSWCFCWHDNGNRVGTAFFLQPVYRLIPIKSLLCCRTAGQMELQYYFWTGQYIVMNSCKQSDIFCFTVALRTLV